MDIAMQVVGILTEIVIHMVFVMWIIEHINMSN
jgi:hypothetical protein